MEMDTQTDGTPGPKDPIQDLQRRVRILETRNQLANASVENASGETVMRSTGAGLEVLYDGALKLVSRISSDLQADVDWVNARLETGGDIRNRIDWVNGQVEATNRRLNEGGDIDGRLDATWAHAQKGVDAGRGAQSAANAAQSTANQALAAARAGASASAVYGLLSATYDRLYMLQTHLNQLRARSGQPQYPYPGLPDINVGM